VLRDDYYCSDLNTSHNFEVSVDGNYYILHDIDDDIFYKFCPNVDIRNYHIITDVQNYNFEPCTVSNSIFTSVNSYKLVVIFVCIFYLVIKIINLGSVALMKGGLFGDI